MLMVYGMVMAHLLIFVALILEYWDHKQGIGRVALSYTVGRMKYLI